MCAAVCETKAMTLAEGVLAYSRELCTNCGRCAKECFSGALDIAGKEMSVEEVMREVVQDIAYYHNSGGGLKVGGGEVICQSRFAYALLSAAKEAGILTAIETNMHADWSEYERLLPVLDLVMLDIKLSEEEAHRHWTGASNRKLLENIRKLAGTGMPMIIRTPVIPGINDSAEEIGSIAALIRELKYVVYYELLLFNPLGESKYDALEINNEFAGARPQDAERQAALREAAEKAGVPVRIG
jgi:pyruvate formate lyase activating enzyme